ncbi:unnamed protein product [Caenorhabditis angaria]|uniref:Uncharacterized protein n=1 Tax=Caenorhabditis angaria TaxID=860376 RepID=A0A9P1IZ18_9PELO|nr:unnamed protein product [Caenorhabditis angaria]
MSDRNDGEKFQLQIVKHMSPPELRNVLRNFFLHRQALLMRQQRQEQVEQHHSSGGRNSAARNQEAPKKNQDEKAQDKQ